MAGPWEKYTSQPSGKPWEKYAAPPPPPPETVPERKGLFTTRDTSGNVSLGGYAGDALVGGYNALSGLGGALGETLSGAPVTSDMQQKAIEAAPLAIGVNPAVRAGDAAIPGMLRNTVRHEPAVPTGAELKTASDAGFDTARGMGVDYHGNAVAQVAKELQARLMKEGISPSDAARTYPKLDELASPPPGANSSFSELYSARKAFARVAQDYNATGEDRMAATMAIKTIDDFFENPIPSSVLAGPAAAVGEVAREARGNAAAGFRSQDLVANQASAELKASVANSGRNVDNAIRQRAGYLIDPLHPERMSGFSAEEKAAIEAVAKGTPLRNNLRYVGNLLGGGGGLGMALTGTSAGALGGSMGSTAMGAAAGLTFPAIGASSKAIANALAKRAMGGADELVRRRSPLYEQRLAEAPMEAAPTAAKAAALKALILALQERRNSRRSGGGGY